MRSSWIAQVSSKSNDKYPYKSQSRERKRERIVRVNMTTQAEIEVMQPQVKECGCHQKLEEAENRFSPRALGGSMALPDFVILASRTVR